jgi:truncated hemoglobin YjbI
MQETLFLKYGGSSLLIDVVEDFYGKVVQQEGLKHFFVGHDIERL